MLKIGMILIIILGLLGLFWGVRSTKPKIVAIPDSNFDFTPIITPTPSPSPTPKPLTFAEMNARYGPCVALPVLMYHHIQTEASAKAKNQAGLSVYTPIFSEQMQYLQDHGYVTVGPAELLAFFNESKAIPGKAVMLTFDDGYADNFSDAFPILKEKKFKATFFLPTGLMDNPDYLTWNQVMEMQNSGLINLANHTWSHKNMQSDINTDMREMQTADEQLSGRGLNNPKVFAYPYGIKNNNALANLNTLGYTLAFSTTPGRVLCEKQRLTLPRIRMSNRTMASLGF